MTQTLRAPPFYIHFRDKEAAVWVVLEEHFARLVEVLSALDNSDAERWRYRKIVVLFEFVAAHKPLMSVLLSERSHVKLVQQIGRFMATTLQGDYESGRIPQTTMLPTEFEANFYAGALLQVISWWLASESDATPAQLAAMVYTIILRQPAPVDPLP